MKFSRLIPLFMIALLASIPASAQDGYPLAENLPPITPESAAQVTELARVGGVLPGDLVWSPDGSVLAAGTSAGVKLYDADDLTAAPLLIPGGSKDVLFNPAGTILVSGGQLWNARTGNAIAPIGQSDTREFSPSGNILVTSRVEEGETQVFLWDTQGKPLATFDTDSYSLFDGAVFNENETMAAIKLSDLIQLWDVATAQMIATFENTFEVIGQVAFVADGQYLVVENYSDAPYGGPFGEVRLWDTRTGTLVQLIDYAFNLTINPDRSMIFYNQVSRVGGMVLDSLQTIQWDNFGYQLTFSNDGELLVTSGYTSEGKSGIAIWPVDDLQPTSEPDLIIEGREFALSADNQFIAVMNRDSVHIWDVEAKTEKTVFYPNVFRQDYTFNLRFNNTGDQLIISSGNITQTWDVATGELLTDLTLGYATRYNLEKMLAANWVDGRVQVSDLNSGTETLLPIIEYFYGYPVALNASQNKVAFSGDNVQVYDLITGAKDLQIEITPRNLAFTADANHLLLWENVPSNPDVTSLTVHNVAFPFDEYKDKASLGIVSQSRNIERVYDVTTRFLAWATWDTNRSTERVYNLKTGELIACWTLQPNEFIESNTFTPDGKFLIISSHSISGGQHGSISLTIWDVNKIGNPPGCSTAEPLAILSLDDIGFGETLDIVFSADGEQLALSMDYPQYGDGVIHNYGVYLLKTEDLLTPGADLTEESVELLPLQGVYQPQFSPDGQFVLTASSKYSYYTYTTQFQIWDTQTGASVATLAGDGAAAFSSDGALLATHGENGISLWEVASLVDASPEPLITLPNGDYPAIELAFSPDNTRLYARWSGGVVVYGVQGS